MLTHTLYSFDHTTGVANIVLNRPKYRNALNADMRKQITDHVKLASMEARCLVLSARGAAFCVGHDFEDEPAVSPEEVGRVLLEEYGPMIDAMESCSIPIISAVSGPAIGVGVALALVSDIVIMQQNSFFSLPFLERGMIPDAGVLRFLERRAGSQRALAAALFGDRISSSQALNWGLAWKVVDRHSLSLCAQDRATYLSGLSKTAIRNLKVLAQGAQSLSKSELRLLEAKLQVECVLQKQPEVF